VVLYGDRNNWFAAYGYWYLKYYGHERVRLLNGPRERWIAEDRPTTSELPAHPPTTYSARRGDEKIRIDRDEVLRAIDGGYVFVDVRSPQEYAGAETSARGCGRADAGSWTKWGNLIDVPIERGWRIGEREVM
jgi:thiosulfate/3-mercaptopyruvate sulfurtransferase